MRTARRHWVFGGWSPEAVALIRSAVTYVNSLLNSSKRSAAKTRNIVTYISSVSQQAIRNLGRLRSAISYVYQNSHVVNRIVAKPRLVVTWLSNVPQGSSRFSQATRSVLTYVQSLTQANARTVTTPRIVNTIVAPIAHRSNRVYSLARAINTYLNELTGNSRRVSQYPRSVVTTLSVGQAAYRAVRVYKTAITWMRSIAQSSGYINTIPMIRNTTATYIGNIAQSARRLAVYSATARTFVAALESLATRIATADRVTVSTMQFGGDSHVTSSRFRTAGSHVGALSQLSNVTSNVREFLAPNFLPTVNVQTVAGKQASIQTKSQAKAVQTLRAKNAAIQTIDNRQIIVTTVKRIIQVITK